MGIPGAGSTALRSETEPVSAELGIHANDAASSPSLCTFSDHLQARDNRVVKVELLVVESCPNEAPARAALERAMEQVGLTAPIDTVVIREAEAAEVRGFVGSPSFFIDGRDLFPAPGAKLGLACRVYPTDAGLRGVPADHVLTATLEEFAPH